VLLEGGLVGPPFAGHFEATAKRFVPRFDP
jgi:hypothetical protein